MRLFVGIALAPDAVAALRHVRQQLELVAAPDLHWSAPETWHVTLQFLGNVSEQQEGCVVQQLQTIRAAPIPLLIEGLGFFERAGVFRAGLTLSPQLLALQQYVAAAMRRCGFEPEARPYSPHITLARAQGRTGPRALVPLKKAVERSAKKSPAALRSGFTAQEFLLYESFPGSEGSRYEIRARFPLLP